MQAGSLGRVPSGPHMPIYVGLLPLSHEFIEFLRIFIGLWLP